MMTAGTEALRQHRAARQALARATAEASGKFEFTPDGLAPVPQLLLKIGGAEQETNRRRSLDQLAAGIPRDEILEALKASAAIVDDSSRSHFQKWMLVRLGWANPTSAMTNASAIAGKIVNDEGLNDSSLYLQLAVLDNWMRTDLPGAFNWVCQLPDAESRSRALTQILHWAQSLPDSEVRNQTLANSMDELAKTDLPKAWALAESLPEGTCRQTALARLWAKTNPFAVSEWIDHLRLPPEIMQPRTAPWPWNGLFPDSDFGSPILVPAENGSAATNSPIAIKPQE